MEQIPQQTLPAQNILIVNNYARQSIQNGTARAAFVQRNIARLEAQSAAIGFRSISIPYVPLQFSHLVVPIPRKNDLYNQ